MKFKLNKVVGLFNKDCLVGSSLKSFISENLPPRHHVVLTNRSKRTPLSARSRKGFNFGYCADLADKRLPIKLLHNSQRQLPLSIRLSIGESL